MKTMTKLTQEQGTVEDFHKTAAESEKDLYRIMISPESFPSLVLIDIHPTHFGTSDTKSCRSLTVFGINNGFGQTVVVFKDRNDRVKYTEKSKLVKWIQKRGGRVLESQFQINLKQVLQIIPATYKSPRYKQVVEKYTSTYNLSDTLDGIKSLLQRRKRCGDKTRTFACFFHLQELSSLWEMVLYDHMRGEGKHTEALFEMVEEMVCPNQLSEMVIGQTKELIASLIGMKKKKEKSDEGDEDTDEGIEEDASCAESDVKVEEIIQGCANLALRGEGWFFAQSEKSNSTSDEDDYEDGFRVLSSLNNVIINIESDTVNPEANIINIE